MEYGKLRFKAQVSQKTVLLIKSCDVTKSGYEVHSTSSIKGFE